MVGTTLRVGRKFEQEIKEYLRELERKYPGAKFPITSFTDRELVPLIKKMRKDRKK